MTTITVAGGNLFQIAAQYLGDATQWWRIAQYNSFAYPYDPFLSGVITLKLPAVNPTLTGGIPPQ